MPSATARENYPDYSKHQCMVGKHLTLQMYERLFDKVTPSGVTLDKCIQPSVDNTGIIIGLLAGDEHSYEVFKELFDPVIEEQHKGYKPSDKHLPSDFDYSQLVGGHLDERYVRSCRIRVGRCLRGFRLSPSINRAERRQVERIAVNALHAVELDAKTGGTYYPLSSADAIDKNVFLFPKPSCHLMVNSGALRDWPDARGIWHGKNKNLQVWINEEDHLRIVSIQSGGDMRQTFRRLCTAVNEIESSIAKTGHQFMWNDHLGYISTCPSNLGTALRCSVHIELKLLSQDERFEKIVSALNLELRGTSGEETCPIDSVYDISNWARLRNTECQFVQLVIDGVEKLIEMEKRLEQNDSIDDLISAVYSVIDNFKDE